MGLGGVAIAVLPSVVYPQTVVLGQAGGGVTVCNNVTIGASALVLKSITTEYCTVAGIPAKIISIKDPSKPLIRG